VTTTSDWYARAAVELAATSELQAEWARGVTGDAALLKLIDQLPREHRQPSLLFIVAGWCGAPPVPYPGWRPWVVAHWQAIGQAAAGRRTQTNEVGRCIPLLIGLDRIAARHPEPIALLELGASAGLCLGVDRYAYRFDGGPELGSGAPLLATTTNGTGVAPTRMPDIAWRAGIDLAPLDVRDAADIRWLEALLPPDRPDRLARLRDAIATVAADPPLLVVDDALNALAGVAAQVPAGLTLVVASLGTAVYLPPAARAMLPPAVANLAALGRRAHLVAFEPAAAVPGISERLARMSAPEPSPFVLSVDGEPIAYAGPHGDRVSWLTPSG
jgi:hypothetical protein